MPETEDPVNWFNENFREMVETYSLDKDYMQGYMDLLETFCDLVEGEKVLDAGCGWGRDVDYFQRNGFEAKGIDLAEEALAFARQNMQGEFIRSDIKDTGFEDESFQGIWCNSVIHFYPEEEMKEIISEISRITSPGGVFYLSFKLTEDSPESFIRREEDGSRIRRYLVTRSFAEEALKRNGFRVLEEHSEVNEEGFENPVWNVFCRRTSQP